MKFCGFTLIELIVVIAILGILAAIAVPRLIGFTNNAEKSAKAATLRSVQSAYSIYEAEGKGTGWPTNYLEGVEGDATGLEANNPLVIKNGDTSFKVQYDGTKWSLVD